MSTNSDHPGLDLRTPWMNAAGSLGFAPNPRGDVSLQDFGAFVTNPISLRPRKAAQQPRLFNFPGGVLIHTGHPNLGLRAMLKSYAAAWARAPLPIIVHLLSMELKQLRAAMPRLEELENILAIELGLDIDMGLGEAKDLVHIAAGELPLIVQAPPDRALELSSTLIEAGASAISLGPPRGSLPGPDGKLISGRLYGPALFPQTLAVLRQLVAQGIPVIAAGGMATKADGEALLGAGAQAVQMDIALWKWGWILKPNKHL